MNLQMKWMRIRALDVVLFLVGIVGSVGAQGELRDNDKVLGCEENLARQDIAVAVALENGSGESALIVILHPGKSDSSKALTKKRLSRVAQYFRERGARLAKDWVIIALGDEIEGPSRLDYYLNGERFIRLIYPKGKHICIE